MFKTRLLFLLYIFGVIQLYTEHTHINYIINAMDVVSFFTIVHCYDTVHDFLRPRMFPLSRFGGVTPSEAHSR